MSQSDGSARTPLLAELQPQSLETPWGGRSVSLSYLIPGIRASPHEHEESTPVMFSFCPGV